MSGNSRAAAVRVACGTAASQRVARWRERLPSCSRDAWHSAASRGSMHDQDGQAAAAAEHAISVSTVGQTATMIDGCRAAAARVACGTAASPHVASRRDSPPWCSHAASHSVVSSGSMHDEDGQAAAAAENAIGVSAVRQTATMSDGCRAAAACAACGTAASQRVARPCERLPWCSHDARQKAASRGSMAGSGRPRSGSSRARLPCHQGGGRQPP